MLWTIRPRVREAAWLTVTECAGLLMEGVSGLDMQTPKARVSKAATAGRFRTNGKTGTARRIDRDSFSTWRLEQRERDLDAADYTTDAQGCYAARSAVFGVLYWSR